MSWGSIPALTGKPSSVPRLTHPCRVYPRAYGETAGKAWRNRHAGGLSPRLRGNPPPGGGQSTPLRSIPALTGKPSPPSTDCRSGEVYPRAYGETGLDDKSGEVVEGLSPRLRGNPNLTFGGAGVKRSIPALTGKPIPDASEIRLYKVYPRAYGETSSAASMYSPAGGLSPRLRGNPQPPQASLQRLRSIPALTGKP